MQCIGGGWAHVRRKFYDIHVATQSPVAAEALARIGEFYGIEEQIRISRSTSASRYVKPAPAR